MRTKINIFNTTTIIYNHNLKKNTKHIYTAKHINNANSNSLIKKQTHKQHKQDQNKNFKEK